MEKIRKTLKTGKLDIDILKGLLERHTILDPRVIIGPKIGEDAAVIDPGERSEDYWVVTADPITFTTEEIGYYGVVVNMNDIATRGAIPKWFLATLLFPEEGSDLSSSKKSSARSTMPAINLESHLSADIRKSLLELKD